MNTLIYSILMFLTTFLPTHEYRIGTPDDALIIPYEYKVHATVVEKTYEGCNEGCDDEYIVEWNGTLITVVSDDFLPGDEMTIYYHNGEIIHSLYGWR